MSAGANRVLSDAPVIDHPLRKYWATVMTVSWAV